MALIEKKVDLVDYIISFKINTLPLHKVLLSYSK